jgi:hypothetical protein
MELKKLNADAIQGRKATAKIALAAAILSACIGCNEKVTPVAVSSQPQTPQATLTEQKMCSDQAAKGFKEFDATATPKGSLPATYTSHYDAAEKICYMEATTRQMSGGSFLYGHEIWDAFENRGYGSFMSMSKPQNIMECSIKPRGQVEIICKSSDEFNDLALKYFGTTAD